jgi:hypothetical protein
MMRAGVKPRNFQTESLPTADLDSSTAGLIAAARKYGEG